MATQNRMQERVLNLTPVNVDFNTRLKRLMDVFLSALALFALAPMLIVLCIAVKFTSTGPIFYRARRIGQGGRTFDVYKFRSMVTDADKRGPAVTCANDDRVTKVGRLLRRTKLDELPQLINVLKGDMSLVGPRPEDPRYVALYTPEQQAVLLARPGITSAASVVYRNEEAILSGSDWEERYLHEVLPAKLALDLEYVHNPSILKDVDILFRTFLALFE